MRFDFCVLQGGVASTPQPWVGKSSQHTRLGVVRSRVRARADAHVGLVLKLRSLDARLHPLQLTVIRAPWCHGVDSSAVASQRACGRVECSSSCRSGSIFLAVAGLAALQPLRRGKPWRQQPSGMKLGWDGCGGWDRLSASRVLIGLRPHLRICMFLCLCSHADALRSWTLLVRACIHGCSCVVVVCTTRRGPETVVMGDCNNGACGGKLQPEMS